VEVVQKPLSGRPDVQLAVGGGGEPGMDVGQDRAGLAKSIEKPGAPPPASRQRHPLISGQGAGPLGQVFGAEEITAEGAGEKLFRALQRAAEQALERRRYDHTERSKGEAWTTWRKVIR
jgi:hypothetical protein